MSKQHIDSILGNSMTVGLQKNLKDALEDVGVKVPSSVCLWQYPELIRNSLVANTISGINIEGKDIIHINTISEGDKVSYEIGSIYDTRNINRPNYAEPNENWGAANLTVQEVLDDLFKNVLPSVRGIYAGDITSSDQNGVDVTEWNSVLFGKTGIKTGLLPNNRYIRLYLTCQPEPLYISLGNLISELTKGYDVKDSETVKFIIDEDEMSLTANINIIPTSQIDNL